MVTQIKKRDGRIVEYDKIKIEQAIHKAFQATDKQVNESEIKEMAEKIGFIVDQKFISEIPSVEQVQDIVEMVLLDHKYVETARAYILYRQKRKEIRDAKVIMGIEDDLKFPINSLKILEGRYLQRDANRKVIETPKQLFERVARNVASVDKKYNEDSSINEKKFYDMMTSLKFLPNSPTLMNAGTEIQQLSACFVLPVEDSITGIFNSVKWAALIHKSGGGTGFSFSRLRQRGAVVGSTGGIASGPISFMRVFNTATEVIKQGGKRRGANMGILRVDHPDIIDFITAKEDEKELNNFNISVALTEKFMQAVESDGEYNLIDPKTKDVVNSLRARNVFDLMVTMAWKNGEPGVVFIDRLNSPITNPTPHIGEIESTNPCGEQPLLPFESCNLGSINLEKFVDEEKKQVLWDDLKEVVHVSVNFLDNVIDANKFPLQQIHDIVDRNRKIGLGVMGWANMLILLRLPYNSYEAIDLGRKIMKFIDDEAKIKSAELAKKRGVFANFEGSVYDDGKQENKVRNATRTTIAPTGTIGVIANTSGGIEPLFAISYIRKTPQFELLEVNPLFEKIAKERGFYDETLMRDIACMGSIQDVEAIPEDVRRLFLTTTDLTAEEHVKMQAAFQAHVNNAVSKTVNMSFNASTDDVGKVYMLSWKLGCKGCTVYRDGSRSVQVLNVKKNEKKKEPPKIEDFQQETESQKNAIDHPESGPITVDEGYSGGCTTCNL